MTAKTTNNKHSAKKKLIPAVGMLLASAMALTSSTYAWFTMSREVEVQNIQMTATVPEDIQLSLGTIGSHSDTVSLAKNSGYLTSGDVSGVTAPTAVYDWSNTADISHYYTFGRLIPASSNTGEKIFFTPDANGVGKTLKTTARFFTAVDGVTTVAESALTGSTRTNKLNATAHLNTAAAWENGGTRATGWDDTEDDGYYVDIPVWFRTSSTQGAELSVKAYVIDKNSDTNATTDGKELYKAVRVAVLTSAGAKTTDNNIIPVADGDTPTSGTNKYSGASVVDYYAADANTQQKAGAISAVGSQGATAATYSTVTAMSANTAVIDLTADAEKGTGSTYGQAEQYIIRVWLEGEDPDCYNETAGQDWSINLCFNNETTNSGGGGTMQDAAGSNSQQQPQQNQTQTYTITVKANADDTGTEYAYTRSTTNGGTTWTDWSVATAPSGTLYVAYTADAEEYTIDTSTFTNGGSVTVYSARPTT